MLNPDEISLHKSIFHVGGLDNFFAQHRTSIDQRFR